MQNASSLSTQKIVILLVFACVALMTLLFIFHTSHATKQSVLNDQEGTLFPVGRDIKPFELRTAQQPFTDKQLQQHWTLLFFGFTHCSNVCPATFEMLKLAYPELKKSVPTLQVVLLSLDPERDTAEKINAYAKGFHPDFIGVTGDIQHIRKLQSQLGIFATQENPSSNPDNYQIQHSSSILLINPQGKWVGLYPFGLPPTQFISIVKKSVHALG